MNCLIIAGGSLDDAFVLRCCRENRYEYMIAADAGLGFFYRNGLIPDLVVGDFDSTDEDILKSFLKKDTSPEFIRLNPVKDDTDSEHAIREAIRRGATSITMLGATTGKRIDHLLGNIALMGIGLEAGVPITLLDSNNRIRMYSSYGILKDACNECEALCSEKDIIDNKQNTISNDTNVHSGECKVIKISRSEQHGRFLSLVPYQGRVTGVTLTGVKYPLTNYTMEAFSSLGISNEITADEATISFQKGVLLVIESSDL